MPKLKTHKGIKKRFKVSATGKVSHKRCGSSHLMSHKSGKQVRRLRKKSILKVSAEAAPASPGRCIESVGVQPRRRRGRQAGRARGEAGDGRTRAASPPRSTDELSASRSSTESSTGFDPADAVDASTPAERH